MEFDWDEENVDHIARHGLTAAEAEYVLQRPTLDLGFQDWHAEERFAEVGATANGRTILIVTTWRRNRIRVVTAYDASKQEAQAYWSMVK